MQQEDFREKIYPDGDHYSIGFGTHLGYSDAREKLASVGLDYDLVMKREQKISREKALILLQDGIKVARAGAQRVITNFSSQPKEIQDMLTRMAYSHGSSGLKEYKNMNRFISAREYAVAAYCLKLSDWYTNKSTRSRAEEERQILLQAEQKYKSIGTKRVTSLGQK